MALKKSIATKGKAVLTRAEEGLEKLDDGIAAFHAMRVEAAKATETRMNALHEREMRHLAALYDHHVQAEEIGKAFASGTKHLETVARRYAK